MSTQQASTDAPARRLSRGRVAIGGAVAGAAVCAIALAVGSGGPSYSDQVRAALSKLDEPDSPVAWETARRLAEQARETEDRDPAFAGAPEFVLGVVATRTGTVAYDRDRELASAVKLLREADRLGVSDARRVEWSAALGTSLHALGRSPEAKPFLEEAFVTDGDRYVDAGLALAEIEVASSETESIRRADDLLSNIASRPELTVSQRRHLTFLRARAAVKAGRLWEAETALSELTGDKAAEQRAALLWAELRIVQDRPEDARRWLLPLAFPSGVESDPIQTAAAAYLLGKCEERRGDAASAVRAYERAAGLAPESSNGTAAALAAGRLLQHASRDEEALARFRQAIASQAAGRPTPVPPDQFRSDIRAAWDVWIERNELDTATALGEAAAAVLGSTDSLELQAKSRGKAAERTEAEWLQADEPTRAVLEAERLERWRASGSAHRALADTVADTGRTSTALWTAADHLRRGHEFAGAEAALTQLIELKVPNLQAAALVRRGHTRLDLERPRDAANDFLGVLRNYPTAPEAFQARLLLGKAYRNAGQEAEAEAAWRQLLSLDELTPAATEWRLALFSLAELLYRRGVAAIDKGDLQINAPGPTGREAILPLDEAISRFGEFLRRSPDAPEAPEARVFRGDALRRRAELARRIAAVAETENLRETGRGEANRLLEEAISELRMAQAALVPPADHDRLPRSGRELLKATFFDLGNAYAALGRDREAVVSYGAAINRYPDDPRVLAAHLRIAECQYRLGRLDDARSAAEQARLLLDQLPASSLESGPSALDRREWETWLARLGERTERTTTPGKR
jgi:tetratricopeptide (TPR) repeat protein